MIFKLKLREIIKIFFNLVVLNIIYGRLKLKIKYKSRSLFLNEDIFGIKAIYC